jgi:hypothetical protein
LPGGNNVWVEVEASDGFHITRDHSDAAFTVGKKAPVLAAILAPDVGTSLVQSQLVRLVGRGYDLEDGELSGANLVWKSDRAGGLGSGSLLTVTLTTGIHHLELTVRDSDGLTASTMISLTMLADFDDDGLADDYERQHTTLSWWNPTDAGADPDQDRLTSRS